MDKHTACELAYKNGYENGYNKALEEFAEKLKSISIRLPLDEPPEGYVTVSDIDNVSKEMIKE